MSILSNSNPLVLKRILVAIAFLVGARMLTLNVYGFIEPTDARYAFISAQMLNDNEWLMPMIHEGVGEIKPYWSKPPLAFWLMKLSLATFGVNEWGARFPSMLATFATAGLIFLFCKALGNFRWGVISVAVFLSNLVVFNLGGTALIDPILSFFTTGAAVMLAIYFLTDQKPRYALYSAIFLAFAMLTKGPIAALYSLFPVFIFLLCAHRMHLLRSFPWFRVAATFFILTVPWFIAAEIRTPGFLYYFFVVENFRRFFSQSVELTSGSGHRSPYGFALLILPLLLLPWTLFAPKAVSLIKNRLGTRPEILFLCMWGILPVILLSFGRHVLATYLLPCLPAYSLLIAFYLHEVWQSSKLQRHFRFLSYAALGLASLILVGAFAYQASMATESHFVSLIASTILLILTGFSLRLYPNSFCRHDFSSAVIVTCCSMTVALLSVSSGLTDFKSTRNLISHIEGSHHLSDKKLLFLNQIPFSALMEVFSPADSHMSPVAVGEEELVKSDCGVLVVRSKYFALLSDSARKGEWEKVGGWMIKDLGPPHPEHVLATSKRRSQPSFSLPNTGPDAGSAVTKHFGAYV